MNTIVELLDFVEQLPDKFNKTFDGNEISIVKDNDEITIRIESNKDIKDLIAKYKENVEKLDDGIFIEAVEAMSEELNIKEFDKLLALNKFTNLEKETLINMIEQSSEIIATKLHDKITNLIDLYNEF